MKAWNVHKEDGTHIGQVHAATEDNARRAALYKYGLDDELSTTTFDAELPKKMITPGENFSVNKA